MLRALLFDFNGVLVDDEPVHCEALQRALAEEGIELAAERFWGELVGLDDRSCVERVVAGRALPDGRVMGLVARKSSYYEALIRERGHAFFAGARELVEAAAEAGLVLGVVSGSQREEVEAGLAAGGLRSLLKTVVTAADVRRSKPDPEIYRLAIRRLNERPPLPERLLHPHEVAAVEDTPVGLAAAAGAGVATVGVAHTVPAARLSDADLVVESLSALDLTVLARRVSATARGA